MQYYITQNSNKFKFFFFMYRVYKNSNRKYLIYATAYFKDPFLKIFIADL